MTSSDLLFHQPMLLSADDLQRLMRPLRQRHARLEPGLASLVQAFYRHIECKEPPPHLPDDWGNILADLLDLAQRRQPNTLNLHIYQPKAPPLVSVSTPTRVLMINDDIPYLVDTTNRVLSDLAIDVKVLVHPVVAIERDAQGELIGLGGDQSESIMYMEIDPQPDDQIERLRTELCSALMQARYIALDQPAMQAQMLALAEEGNRAFQARANKTELQAYLKWLCRDQFIFFGYSVNQLATHDNDAVWIVDQTSALGAMRLWIADAQRSVVTYNDPSVQEVATSIILTKIPLRSRVHRSGYLDCISVFIYDGQARMAKEHRFIGLFDLNARREHPWDIPFVRQHVAYVVEHAGVTLNSHRGRTLRHILETLPRDELLQADATTLFATVMGIASLQQRCGSGVFVRAYPASRFISVLVYLPRDHFNTDVRLKIESVLKQLFDCDRVDSSVVLGESPLAQLHFIFESRLKKQTIDYTLLEQQISAIVRQWRDDLRLELQRQYGARPGLALATRYANRLPAGYVDSSTIPALAIDLGYIDALSDEDEMCVRLDYSFQSQQDKLYVKLFRRSDKITLSDLLPLMENLGLRVIAEQVHSVSSDNNSICIQVFEVESTVGAIQAKEVEVAFCQAFIHVWHGRLENDGFNQLIMLAQLRWNEIAMIRAFSKYLLQIGVPFSSHYMEQVFIRYPTWVQLFVLFFYVRFCPPGQDHPPTIAERLSTLIGLVQPFVQPSQADLESIASVAGQASVFVQKQLIGLLEESLNMVQSLDEDRILRGFLEVIQATVRTNFFQKSPQAMSAYCLSFKFDSAKVAGIPKPCPYREIFVYSPLVEGIHLRFGPVARGGIRWSDRREDFRTEVLGLAKAQMVKNSLIVPVGAKGGFYVKGAALPSDKANSDRSAIHCYSLFIQCLLDLTDNIRAGQVIPPDRVVRYDGDDWYLVVAADKGTARFSDRANELAIAHGFWLGDAFASGGSAGYDHKAMGITARGAWESVKRHFRALGRDCQAEPFTCVGIGDMSGDVFGNGMLLSPQTLLIAAFDHRHIFLDPNPSAERAYAERQRLFQAITSSWADYDRAAISEGGGVYARNAKTIELSTQIRERLGLPSELRSISAPALIQAILTAPVDLIWNGGIGTYIKASTESHEDASDRTNNSVRVDAVQLRCKLIGEGGNLGLTQRGRIEAAQQGILLNTDFIDNSAGVDTSDHEVNIKILLHSLQQNASITSEESRQLLASMRDDVAQLVLNDTIAQNQVISLMERASYEPFSALVRLIAVMEDVGLLHRDIECLPSAAEISQRQANHQGFTRPELALLLSYAKRYTFKQLMPSDVFADAFFEQELQRYFPAALHQLGAAAMRLHPLKREIIATAVTNALINRMGASVLMRLQQQTGCTAVQVVQAFTISCHVIDAETMWSSLQSTLSLGLIDEATVIDALEAIRRLQWQQMIWLLSQAALIAAIPAAIALFKPAFAHIRQIVPLLPVPHAADFAGSQQSWLDRNLPLSLAQSLAAFPYLESALELIDFARQRQLDCAHVVSMYFYLGDVLQMPWLYAQLKALSVEGRWHELARDALQVNLATHHRSLVAQAVSAQQGSVKTMLSRWLEMNDEAWQQMAQLLEDIKAQATLDYPTMLVVVNQIGRLVGDNALTEPTIV